MLRGNRVSREKFPPAAHIAAEDFLKRLRAHSDDVTMEQFLRLRTQALKGDIEGAEEGMVRLLYGTNATEKTLSRQIEHPPVR